MKILLAGFEPFGEREVNNALEVLRLFANRPNIDIVEVPVSFERAHKVVIEAIEGKSYDFVLMMGETSKTTDYIRLERLAINFKDSLMADNDGVAADEETIVEDGQSAYFTNFPVKQMAEKLKASGHKVKVTNSTGVFVCNSLYYNVLRYVKTTNINIVPLFVHLPASTDVLSLSDMKSAIEELIVNLGE